MSYILKNTNKITNTQITDVGRRKLSEGDFKIKYFQVGDSEICYTCLSSYTNSDNIILEPQFGSENDNGQPQSNRGNIKYPFYLDNTTTNTYGIPYMFSTYEEIIEYVESRGFFTGGTGSWSANTNPDYLITSNYYIDIEACTGGTKIELISGYCNSVESVIFSGCCDTPTPITSTTTTTTTTLGPCDLPPVTGETCVIVDNSRQPGVPMVGDIITILFDCNGSCGEINNSPILTYKICCIVDNVLTLDREIPNLASMGYTGNARVLIYPSNFNEKYDSITPQPYWNINTISFENSCDISNNYVKIWNMNIPWSEVPAGMITTKYNTDFNSKTHLGSKEYFGYQSSKGQNFIRFDGLTGTTDTYYFNSFNEKIYLEPEDQKTITIIHYSNNGIDFEYGEKLGEDIKIDIPWLMWHKTTGTTIGESFYTLPPNSTGVTPCYMISSKDDNMNNPGLRYYHLWDVSENRVGKVFPDSKIVIIDDEELVAAMSYKSNRNWTLPAPKVSLISPNLCIPTSLDGLLKTTDDYFWVTYRLTNDEFTNSLHCNYYTLINLGKEDCNTGDKNIAINFGNEFTFLKTGTTCNYGYFANKLEILIQKVNGNVRPNPNGWKKIDVTSQIDSSTIISGLLSESSLTTTFIIDSNLYSNATQYNLNNYIKLQEFNSNLNCLNFGDEYYFYGNVEGEIKSTVFEMKYVINLTNNQFNLTTNPTWNQTKPYISEIGLYNENKELLMISKLQSPQIREGIQQFALSYIF
jgi:hypothetical protein